MWENKAFGSNYYNLLHNVLSSKRLREFGLTLCDDYYGGRAPTRDLKLRVKLEDNGVGP